MHGSGSSKSKKSFANRFEVELLLRTPSSQRDESKISLKVITQPRDELLGLDGLEIENYKNGLKNFLKVHNPETDGSTIKQARR